jgi:putative transport protein
MNGIRDLLLRDEALLLFLIIGIGYLIGEIKVKGFSLGVAAVLFVGLAFGSWQPEGAKPFQVAHAVLEVGLVLFVYAVGLTSGPGFFRAFRDKGMRYNLCVAGAVLGGAVVAMAGGRLMDLEPGMIAGAFCGGLTNTPAMAAASQYLRTQSAALASQPVVGYSVSYPLGLLGGVTALYTLTWLNRGAFAREREERAAAAKRQSELTTQSYVIASGELAGKAIGALRIRDVTGVQLTRIRRAGSDVVRVPTKYDVLGIGDTVTGFGPPEKLRAAVAYFGRESEERLDMNRDHVEILRVLMSRKALVGMKIEELGIDEKFGAQITRVRRADREIMPTEGMTLALGDRLRIVAPREKVAEVTHFFGDSERAKMDLDYTAMTLGISAGVLLGMLPIPVPGLGSVSLGFAGGPLIVALVLGYLGRTGPIVWAIPLEASETIRHIGLLLFLAGVGVLAGNNLVPALSSNGLEVAALGFAVTLATATLCITFLRVFAKAPVIDALGTTSAMLTQPSTLEISRKMSGTDDVYVCYATSQPVAQITKIILAQLLVMVGMRFGVM